MSRERIDRDLVNSIANKKTPETVNKVEHEALREKRNLSYHQRAFWSSAILLLVLIPIEVMIAFSFISYMIADLEAHTSSPLLLSFIVVVAMFVAHYMISHEGDQKLAARMRKFTLVGILVLPFAMSLGLAVNLANSIGNTFSVGSNNSFLQDGQTNTNLIGSLSNTMLDTLNALSPILVVLAFGSALMISMYAAHIVIKISEKHYDYIRDVIKRYPDIAQITQEFRNVDYPLFSKLYQRYQKMISQVPSNHEEIFAQDLRAAMLPHINELMKFVEQYPFGEKNPSFFEGVKKEGIYIPSHIQTREQAIDHVKRMKAALRTYEIAAALGGVAPKRNV